ncbi:MAG: hypothetical protein AABX83_03815 [Nanoarchaeota archaeon]
MLTEKVKLQGEGKLMENTRAPGHYFIHEQYGMIDIDMGEAAYKRAGYKVGDNVKYKIIIEPKKKKKK